MNYKLNINKYHLHAKLNWEEINLNRNNKK